MTQVSAIERLMSLPAIFRGADLTVRFHWTSKTASHYLYLWKKRGLVDGLGGHSDVFVNLLQNRQPNWEYAVRLAMPSAILIGVEALRRAGWTTQIQHRPTLAVNRQQPVFTADRFDIQAREASWFEAVGRYLDLAQATKLPALAPSWALADMLNAAGWGACGLDPDDIEWSAVSAKDRAHWRAAAAYYGLSEMAVQELLQRSKNGKGEAAGAQIKVISK